MMLMSSAMAETVTTVTDTQGNVTFTIKYDSDKSYTEGTPTYVATYDSKTQNVTVNLSRTDTRTYNNSELKSVYATNVTGTTVTFSSSSYTYTKTNTPANNSITYTPSDTEYKKTLDTYYAGQFYTYEYAQNAGWSIASGNSDYYFQEVVVIPNTLTYAVPIQQVILNSTITNTTKINYTPTKIAANCFNGNTTTKTVNIEPNYTEIEAGAFYNSKVATITATDSKSFTIENNILYNAAKTTVIAAGAGVTGTITLPSSVTTVYDYAFANCSNLTVVTTATTIGEHQGSTRIGSENSVFDESDLKITKSGNGLIVTGEVASSNINNIWSDYTKSSICYVDFTGSTVHGSVTITNNGNPNCLFFFKAGDKASGTNVVVDEKCATMTFNESYGFHSPYQFTVTGTTKYTRAAALTAGQWSTVCLPFRGTSTNGLTFGYLKSFNNNNLTFLKTTDSRVEGGIIMAENGGTSFTFSDVIVPITNSSNQYTKSVDGATSVGNLIATNYGEAAATFPGNNIYTVSGGKLVICSGTVQWRAYRAYFAISQSSKAPAMRVEEEDGNIVELGTAIDLIEVAPKVEVNIASIEGGLSLTTQEAGRVTVYSMDGKKMFDGIVEGSKDILLNKGIYAINNKKVIVK